MLDNALHFAGGFAITAILLVAVHSLAFGLALVATLALFGWLRELNQHQWEPLSRHSKIEALTWPLGALAALPVLWLL